MRSPLAAAALAVELAQRKPSLDEARGVLQRAGRTLQRSGQLIDGLLALAQAGIPPTEGTAAQADQVVADVVENLRATAADKDVELQVAALDRCQVACGPGVLANVVYNLVGNAIKFTASAPVRRVSVSLRCPGRPAPDGQVLLEVEDTGPGVPPQLRDQIFEPYVRGPDPGAPGLGLGLATVWRLVTAHGGTMGLASPAAGSGARFWVKLPLVAGPSSPG
jgi:signal transduction histidine kinase